MFAAAAIADGRSKRKRNEQWDKAIEGVKQELEDLGEGVDGGLLGVERAAEMTVQHSQASEDLPQEVGREGRIQSPEPKLEPPLAPPTGKTADLSEFLQYDTLLPGTPRPAWPANTTSDSIPAFLPPQSLWSSDKIRQEALQRPRSWKKIAVQELAIAKLVHRLILNSGLDKLEKKVKDGLPGTVRELVKEGEARGSRSKARDGLTEIVGLLEETCRMKIDSSIRLIEEAEAARRAYAYIPTYLRDNRSSTSSEPSFPLNQSLKTIFDSVTWDSPLPLKQEAIAKICHNLLVSSSPPTTHTFNILLLGFSKWAMNKRCDDVIRAIDDAKVRPNEITCAAILEHYLGANDPEGFSRFVGRMTGWGNPLMMARWDVNVTDESRNRLVVDESRPGKVGQKVFPTPLVFGSLLRGVLRFVGFEGAMRVYEDLKCEGWGVDVRMLVELIRDCALVGHWVDGYLLWEEFRFLRSKFKISPPNSSSASSSSSSSSSAFPLDTDMESLYACMLVLCKRGKKEGAYTEVFNEAMRLGLDEGRLESAVERVLRKSRYLRNNRKQVDGKRESGRVMEAAVRHVEFWNEQRMNVEAEEGDGRREDEMVGHEPVLFDWGSEREELGYLAGLEKG